jgi:hypothetical protein
MLFNLCQVKKFFGQKLKTSQIGSKAALLMTREVASRKMYALASSEEKKKKVTGSQKKLSRKKLIRKKLIRKKK